MAEGPAPRPKGHPGRLEYPLSVPQLSGGEEPALVAALESGWVAPVGPDVDAFEEELARAFQCRAALATSSGTAALHLALLALQVKAGAEVLVSTLTFCASANPALYVGARPTFVDSEPGSWAMDPELVEEELDRRGRAGKLPGAVVVVHIYGRTADVGPMLRACRRWDVPLIEDAAEAAGSSVLDMEGVLRPAGSVGDVGILSFDGSKMITTSRGGAFLSNHPHLVERARKLARQAREPVPHYEHREVGFNYRMSNLLAAVGRVQLSRLDDHLAGRRRVFRRYQESLGHIPGLRFQGESPDEVHSRWLTTLRLDPEEGHPDPATICRRLRSRGVEARRAWKPLHLQPVYVDLGLQALGGHVAETIFDEGLCLPSSPNLSDADVAEISQRLQEVLNGPE